MHNLSYYTNFRDALTLHESNLKVYFDSSDAISCVQGFRAFFDNSKTQPKEDFLHNNTLVYSLVCALLTPKIHLLPAHQNEFIKKLNPENYAPNYDDIQFKTSLQELLRDVLVTGLTSKRITEKNLNQGENLFKVASLLMPFDWRSRLYQLVTSDKRIILYDYIASRVAVQDTDLALKFYTILDTKRPHLSINNMADAVALEYFSQEVKKAQEEIENGTSLFGLDLPLLFISDNSIINLVYNDEDLVSKFSIELKSGTKILLLRQAEFFVCLSLLKATEIGPVEGAPTSADRYLRDHDHNIETFKTAIKENTAKVENFTLLEDTSNKLVQINEQLRYYINNDFFLRIVLRCFTKKDNIDIAEYLSKKQRIDISLLKQEPKELTKIEEWIKTDYAKQIQKLNEAITSYNEQYHLLFLLASGVKKLAHVLNKFKRIDGNHKNLYHHVSLTRFFIPENFQFYLYKKIFEPKFLYNEKLSNEYAQELFKNYNTLRTSFNIEDQQHLSTLYELLSILWLTRAYSFAHALYNPSLEYHPSLLMLFGACFVRDDTGTDGRRTSDETRRLRTYEIINQLRETLFSLSSNERKEKVLCCIAMSFLYYQLIALDKENIFTNSKRNFDDDYKTSDEIDECLSYARDAWELRNTTKDEFDGIHIQLYTTNILIYYSVEIASTVHLNKLGDDVITEFAQSARKNPSYWHYRYEDTIARYYYRLSEIDDSIESKRNLASRALERLKRATELFEENTDFRDVRDIQDFCDILVLYQRHLK